MHAIPNHQTLQTIQVCQSIKSFLFVFLSSNRVISRIINKLLLTTTNQSTSKQWNAWVHCDPFEGFSKFKRTRNKSVVNVSIWKHHKRMWHQSRGFSPFSTSLLFSLIFAAFSFWRAFNLLLWVCVYSIVSNISNQNVAILRSRITSEYVF